MFNFIFRKIFIRRFALHVNDSAFPQFCLHSGDFYEVNMNLLRRKSTAWTFSHLLGIRKTFSIWKRDSTGLTNISGHHNASLTKTNKIWMNFLTHKLKNMQNFPTTTLWCLHFPKSSSRKKKSSSPQAKVVALQAAIEKVFPFSCRKQKSEIVKHSHSVY